MSNKLIGLATLTLALTLPAGAALATTAYVSNDLNLRSGPGTQYGRIATIPRGSPVDVQGCNPSNWCNVNWSRYSGWVSGSYLVYGQQQYSPPVTTYPAYPTYGYPYYGYGGYGYGYAYPYWFGYDGWYDRPYYNNNPPRPGRPPVARPPGALVPPPGVRPPGGGKPPPGYRPPYSGRPPVAGRPPAGLPPIAGNPPRPPQGARPPRLPRNPPRPGGSGFGCEPLGACNSPGKRF